MTAGYNAGHEQYKGNLPADLAARTWRRIFLGFVWSLSRSLVDIKKSITSSRLISRMVILIINYLRNYTAGIILKIFRYVQMRSTIPHFLFP